MIAVRYHNVSISKRSTFERCVFAREEVRGDKGSCIMHTCMHILSRAFVGAEKNSVFL